MCPTSSTGYKNPGNASLPERTDVSEEVDKWGFPVDPAKRMQQVMLALYDLGDEARMADFSPTCLPSSTSCA
jgi:hypothetical protein